MNSLGCAWKPSEKGAGSRVQGVSALHQPLAVKRDGYDGGLVIFRGTRNLIRTHCPRLCIPRATRKTFPTRASNTP